MSDHVIARRQLPVFVPSAAGLRVRPPMIRRAAGVGMDALTLLAVVVSIPFVILAAGLPIALAARLVLWLGRLL